MHFISSERPKTASSGTVARYAIGSLFLAGVDWKLKIDLLAPAAANQCTFTCGLITLSVSDVQNILPAEPSTK
jgi:hypothetical protein